MGGLEKRVRDCLGRADLNTTNKGEGDIMQQKVAEGLADAHIC